MACFLHDLHTEISDREYPCKHYILWRLLVWELLLYSMIHYDITMGNDVARDILCDVTMSNDIAMCTYHATTMLNGIAMSFFYYVLLCPIMILLFPQFPQSDHFILTCSCYNVTCYYFFKPDRNMNTSRILFRPFNVNFMFADEIITIYILISLYRNTKTTILFPKCNSLASQNINKK